MTFFWKSFPLWGNVKKCDGTREVTNDDTVWRIRGACWISKATRAQPGHPHARTHARTHGKICNTCCFSVVATIHQRASVLHCTYIVCLFWILPLVYGVMIILVWLTNCRTLENVSSFYSLWQQNSQLLMVEPCEICHTALLKWQ